MYNVMLIDDEKLITEGLTHIIDWEKLGLKVVATAEDGEEALEKIKKIPVNIVLTDINMPKMSGLDFIKEVQKFNKQVRFIILSGYDEFSYAKKAIEYGVKNYILKPINENELIDVLKNIIDSINMERKNKNIVLDKNRIFIDFLNGNIDIDNIHKIRDQINIPFKNKYYTVANIIINKRKNYCDIEQILDKNTIEKYEILYKFDEHFLLINSWDYNISFSKIKEYYNLINNSLREDLNADIFISVGDLVKEFNNLKESYRIANNLKKYILTEGTNKSLFSYEIENIKENKRNFEIEIDVLNKLIIEKDESKVINYITKIFDDNELTPQNIYDLSVKIIILIDKILGEFNLESKIKNESLSTSIIYLYKNSTRSSIKKFIINELKKLIYIMNTNYVKYSPVVQQIINNINERYYEDLSLKILARQYNINSSYLGQIFTKEVGISFSEYLNKIKNMKAKELILETNMKINNIAREVGYSDTSYFYRKFKKYYGICPSSLRELKNY